MRRLIAILTLVLAVVAGSTEALGQETFKRKLEQVSFVPKGAWITGVSVSYSQSDPHFSFFLPGPSLHLLPVI